MKQLLLNRCLTWLPPVTAIIQVAAWPLREASDGKEPMADGRPAQRPGRSSPEKALPLLMSNETVGCTMEHFATRGRNMDNYRLHYFPESGNSYKLALMLTLCGQNFEPVWTDFGSRVTWTTEWRRTVNPMGEIPVLEAGERKLTQTAPILLQLAKQFGRLGPTNEEEQFDVLRWLFWDNQKLSGSMATYRFMRTFTPKADPAVLAWHLARVKDFLGILDAHLAAHAFVACDRLTIADISMCAYLSYPVDETGIDLATAYPSVDRWLKSLAATPGWRSPYDLLPGKRLTRFDQQ